MIPEERVRKAGQWRELSDKTALKIVNKVAGPLSVEQVKAIAAALTRRKYNRVKAERNAARAELRLAEEAGLLALQERDAARAALAKAEKEIRRLREWGDEWYRIAQNRC